MRPVRYRPGEALLALYRRRGPVIDAGAGRHGYTLLLGAEANKFVFANADAFSWRATFENLALVDGPTALIVSDGDDHRRRRSVVAPGLRHRQIQDYVTTMVSCIDRVIDGWRPGQRLDVYQHCRAAVRRSTAESLFGPRLAVHSDALGEHLQPLLDLTHQPPQLVGLQRRINAPAWRRAMAARQRINNLVDTLIADARAAPNPNDHMLTMLIDGRGDEGYTLSDNEIRDAIVSLVTAGYETTSGALAWAVYLLLSQPGAWATAAGEVRRVLAGLPPAAADLSGLTYLNGVVHEAAVPARGDLRAPGDARSALQGQADPIGAAVDLQPVRHPPASRNMARAKAIRTRTVEPRCSRVSPGGAARVHPVQCGAAPLHGGRDGHHRDDGDARAAAGPHPAAVTRSAPARANVAALRPTPGLTVEVIDSVPAQ